MCVLFALLYFYIFLFAAYDAHIVFVFSTCLMHSHTDEQLDAAGGPSRVCARGQIPEEELQARTQRQRRVPVSL